MATLISIKQNNLETLAAMVTTYRDQEISENQLLEAALLLVAEHKDRFSVDDMRIVGPLDTNVDSVVEYYIGTSDLDKFESNEYVTCEIV